MNKLFAIVLSIVLSLPIITWAVDETALENTTEQPVVVNQLDEDIEEAENQFKQPVSKKKIAKKFLAAMGGVAISSFAIFSILTMYNRIRERFTNPIRNVDGETTLETPRDIDSAVKTFLDKTNW